MAHMRGCNSLQYLYKMQYSGDTRLAATVTRHRFQRAHSLYRKDLFAHYGCVNAIEFSTDGEWLVSGGDDRRVLLWNVESAISSKEGPKIMKGEHNSNIFCLGFDAKHRKLYSAGNDEQVIVHDVETGDTLDVFLHEDAVYGLSVDPLNDSVFASACDDGRILIWDTREPSTSDPFTLANCSSAFHAVIHNPVEPRLVATANSKEGVGLWDVRKPRCCLLKFGGCLSAQSSMSVRFNSSGTYLLALRRRLPPVLYHISSKFPAVEFDHPGYYNSCTMKSCCFAGDTDQYILSGSDDFKLYMWKIPEAAQSKKGIWVGNAHLVLHGHRSIVNQVRYNSFNSVVASSGVEKIVKLWSFFPFPGDSNELQYDIKLRNGLRRVYSHEEYINLVLESGHFMTHDYSHQSVKEDPRMMAFFDSLVQRDIEGWSSDSSATSTNTDIFKSCFEVQSGGSDSKSSTPVASSSSDDDEFSQEAGTSKNTISLSPQTVSYITSLTSRVENGLAGTGDTAAKTDSVFPPVKNVSLEKNPDRISQLIAQKRQEQLLKVAKAALELTKKRLKKSKKIQMQWPTSKSGDNGEEKHKSLDSVRQVLDAVIRTHAKTKDRKDKRKSLQRKRAKILQGTTDSDLTDSEDAQNAVCNNSPHNSVNTGKESKASENCEYTPRVPLPYTTEQVYDSHSVPNSPSDASDSVASSGVTRLRDGVSFAILPSSETSTSSRATICNTSSQEYPIEDRTLRMNGGTSAIDSTTALSQWATFKRLNANWLSLQRARKYRKRDSSED